ncbi:MAG: hypothetical protein JXB20_04480 [Bacilli bacterium]|nr:hypothetical protein [Bacilli bacterium]MBN2696286.1 hypothetical protein [Bacilli bacterium]
MILTEWGKIIEISLIVIFLIGVIVVGSIFVVRSIQSSYREVYKFQSKFDIELRKMINLLSKINGNAHGRFKDYVNIVVKDLPHDDKSKLLMLIETAYDELDKEEETNKYLIETYENLQEVRRIRDSKAIIFNHKIIMFPFNIYAGIMKLEQWDLFLHQKQES